MSDTATENELDQKVQVLKKKESLTKAEEAKLEEIKQKWLDKFFKDKEPVNKEAATELVNWVYKLGGFPEPKLYFVDDPNQAQELANKIMNEANGTDTTDCYYDFAYYLSVWDYGWCAFYEFFTDIGVIKYEPFNKFKNLLFKSNIYDTIQFDEACIVVNKPSHVSVNEEFRLHAERGAAISWRKTQSALSGGNPMEEESYAQFFHNNIPVPRHWKEAPETITLEEILNETNIERKRCVREILGTEKYFELLDTIELDRDTDPHGNAMILHRTREIFPDINEYIYFAEVVCTTSGRQYVICVPPNLAEETGRDSNVWDAIAWTFGKDRNDYAPSQES